MADYESRIANVEVEAEQIINDAKDSAKVEYGKIIDRAEIDARQLKDNAKKQIQAETENARKAAKEEIASLAMQAAEKVVGANVSDKTNSDIFDEFLNESSVD
jgi:F-type H+-transporting ATPase subunit b